MNLSLPEKILRENQLAHDYYAPYHNTVCSYISRPSCHQFYQKMLSRLTQWESRDKKNCRVLELGCGTGTWCSFFHEAQEYVGIDISPEMIEQAKASHHEKQTQFHLDDAVSFLKKEKEKNRTYDLIISSSFLHHLYDIDELLLLISTLLSPKGIYLALHEPMKSLENSDYKTPLGKRIDNKIGFLCGYDCDLPRNSFFKRLMTTFLSFIPFKSTLKSVFTTQRALTEKNESINFVDFKLSQGQRFHPSIFLGKYYPNLSIEFDLYSYYTFPSCRQIFGECQNYFYLRCERQ